MVMTPAGMLDRAVAGGASIETLERLMALYERWMASERRRAFDAAIAAAKAEIPVIRKNRHVGFESKRTGSSTDYDFEDFAEIARTVDPILAKHGLSYRFRTAMQGDLLTVTCILSHVAGHSGENQLPAPRDMSGNKNPIQALGSTQTYLQRYTLKAALGLAAAKDDDAGSASALSSISPEDVQLLREKMAACEMSEQRFCAAMKVASIEDLPASRFDEADRRLGDYARQKAAREASNG